MSKTSQGLNILSKILTILVDDSTPYRTHNAISIYAAVTLGLCTLIMTFACIYSKKSLAYELATLVTALAGLTGYQFAKGVNAPPILPPNPSNNSNATNSEKTEESKES